MRTQLHDWPIEGLKEVIAIDKLGNVIHIYPRTQQARTVRMAISYDLDMATQLPVAQFAGELVHAARADGLFDASVTSGLLNRVPGDVVLHSSFEHIWLLRRYGDLSVREQEDIWPQHRLALLSSPYHRTTHTFLGE